MRIITALDAADLAAAQAMFWWRVAFRCSPSKYCLYCSRAMRVGWASLEGYACPKCYQQYHGGQP